MARDDSKDPRRMAFTDLGIRRLNIDNRLKAISAKTGRTGLKQALVWDEGCRGLCLLISSGGAKTFRCQFKLNGKWISHTLGRYGEMLPDADPGHEDVQVGEGRRLTADYRAKASKGIDPRRSGGATNDKKSFGYVVDQFIEHYAKHRQRTWDQTERILKVSCAPLLPRPIAEITKQEVRELLRSFVSEGHPYKARVADAWLRKLFRWASLEDYIETSIMDGVAVEISKRARNRVYSKDEVAAIWQAANSLEPIAGAYFKLLLLLAPRRTALAAMQWSHLDDADNPSLWTTPHELTKSKKSADAKPRKYLTPLPALARRILKSLPHGHERVFPTVPMAHMKTGVARFIDTRLINQLIKAGAPEDFYPHAIRHTIATFLENAGHSQWERGLILNHTAQGVTADYSHGDPRQRKLALLEQWASHVEGLVQPGHGVTVLR